MAYADDTELIDTFEEFYRSYYQNEIGELAQKYPDEQKSLYVDWDDLYRFDPALADDFQNKPKQLQEYAEEALRLYDLPVNVSLGQAHLRVRNLPERTDIRDIRADHRGKLVEVIGTVDKTTDVRPQITTAAFECQRCGTLTRIPQVGGDFQEPHECQGCERQGPFRVNYDQSELIDSQKVYLKEFTRDITTDNPQGVEVTIEDDATGQVTVGDDVAITAIVKLQKQGSSRNKSAHFDFYLEGVAVEPVDQEYPEIQLTDGDKKEIVKLSNQDDLFDQFIGSVAPTVHGSETEKLGLALQWFGGIEKHYEDGSYTRGSIHTLFVNDPGIFVDRMLESAVEISPRAVEISGSETSGTGLTTTAVRSSDRDNSGGWAIEAGPLIKADGGHALINGVDDLGSAAESSLETVLTQQSVDASKASASTSLEARTSVLALGRPTYGRFDEYEPIGEQVDLSPDLIGAFDLMFLSTDQPDKAEDEKRADRVLKAAYSGQVEAQQDQPSLSNSTEEDIEDTTSEIASEIELDLLQKYIAYAQRMCFPTITDDARTELRDYYVDLRSRGGDPDAPVPISEQKLESLVRLAEGSARARLSDTVEVEDAQRAITVFKHTLRNVGLDPETAEFDAEVIETRDSEEQREKLRNTKQLIAAIEEEFNEGAPVDVIIERAEEEGIDPERAKHEIDKLKQKGKVYEPKTDHLRAVPKDVYEC